MPTTLIFDRQRRGFARMTTGSHRRNVLGHPVSAIAWRRAFVPLLAVVLIVTTIVLTAIGLGALDELMARGFVSISNPSG